MAICDHDAPPPGDWHEGAEPDDCMNMCGYYTTVSYTRSAIYYGTCSEYGCICAQCVNHQLSHAMEYLQSEAQAAVPSGSTYVSKVTRVQDMGVQYPCGEPCEGYTLWLESVTYWTPN